MKYNTTPIKNVGDESFVGKFNGVEFRFEPGEERFLPTFVSEHLAKQLEVKLQKKDPKKNIIELLNSILGEEINTKTEASKMTFKDEVDQHEKDFKEFQKKKTEEEDIKRKKAEEILNEDNPE